MLHAMRWIVRGNVLLVLLLLGALFASTGRSATQVPAMDTATLTGTAYRLVDQTIVDGVVIHETELAVTDGRIAIPELGIDMPLAADGTFRLSDLPVSADPRNQTEVTVIFTAPDLGSFTYLHLRLYPGHVGPNLTPQLIDTPRVDDLSRGHRGTGPALLEAGGGGSIADGGWPVVPALIALVGVVLICAAAAARYNRSAR